MRRAAWLAPVVLCAAACGTSTEATPPASPGSGTTSAGAGGHATDDAASSSKAREPLASAPRCVPVTTARSPAGWVEVGLITVVLEDDRPVRFTVADAKGTLVDAAPAPKDRLDALHWIERAICKVGGLVALANEPVTPHAKTARLPIMAPRVPDERADLALLCREPEGLPVNADPAQRVVAAVAIFESNLTTAKWRTWLRDMGETIANEPSSRAPVIRRARADVLAQSARTSGLASCWFEAQLRS